MCNDFELLLMQKNFLKKAMLPSFVRLWPQKQIGLHDYFGHVTVISKSQLPASAWHQDIRVRQKENKSNAKT